MEPASHPYVRWMTEGRTGGRVRQPAQHPRQMLNLLSIGLLRAREEAREEERRDSTAGHGRGPPVDFPRAMSPPAKRG